MMVESVPATFGVRRVISKPCWLGVIAVLGLVSAIVGLAILVVHSETPGAKGIAPVTWPRASRMTCSESGATLLVFLHPHCPCGRATVKELSQLIDANPGVLTIVVLLRPKDVTQGWERGLIRDMCLPLKDVRIHTDDGGGEARLFNVATSGHVCLYDKNQRLQYSGGVTGARGHEGGNAGIDALQSILAGSLVQTGAPVFGCPLFSKCEQNRIK